MSGEGPNSRINNLRTEAIRVQHEGENRDAEKKEKEPKDGARAAEADTDMVLKAVEKAMDKGKTFYELPKDFRSQAGNLKYQKVLYNSDAFLKAYASTLQKVLGSPFFVSGGDHHGEAHVRILWSPRKKGRGGHH
jgi:hypothetical protein